MVPSLVYGFVLVTGRSSEASPHSPNPFPHLAAESFPLSPQQLHWHSDEVHGTAGVTFGQCDSERARPVENGKEKEREREKQRERERRESEGERKKEERESGERERREREERERERREREEFVCVIHTLCRVWVCV